MNGFSRIFILLTLISSSVFSQTTSEKRSFSIPKASTVNVSELKEEWNPVLQNIEAPKHISNKEKQRLKEIKDSLQLVYPKKYTSTSLRNSRAPLPSPYVGKNFQGNTYNLSTPNDNELAISDSNKLISVMNTSVFSYNVNTSTQLSFVSLGTFGSSLAIPHSKYDPKVIYDPNADRFILVYLNGFTDTTSSITVAFSQTNNPIGSWNLYSLPGNPLNNGLWSDYPMVGMTDKEFFLTINLLYPDSSWQTGFNETLIWQIEKDKGYSGQTLNTKLHNNIQHNGRKVRNLCPVKGGSTLYSPDMYFLSDRNLDAQNDTIFLVRITDTINAPGQIVTVQPLKSNTSYFAPPPASQTGPGTQLLETNDARILGAFIENNKIQFVSNTLDTTTGFCAIYHGVIDNVNSSPSVKGHVIGDTLLELGYPNICYIGSGPNDNRSLITINHTALTVNPGLSTMLANDTFNYSPLVNVKSGQNYISILPQNERWGDYSGSQRKYNEPGKAWINGTFGNSSRKNTTWVAEISLNPFTGINDIVTDKPSDEMLLFPNPVEEIVTIEFELEKPNYLVYEIYDINGKLVKQLMREKTFAGKNRFSFSANQLNSGTYFINIYSENTVLFSKKFVKK